MAGRHRRLIARRGHPPCIAQFFPGPNRPLYPSAEDFRQSSEAFGEGGHLGATQPKGEFLKMKIITMAEYPRRHGGRDWRIFIERETPKLMSRRRYVSTEISTDGKVNELSDQAALLFTWAIPHFADDCRLTPQNAAEIKLAIIPGRNWTVKHIEGLINEIFALGLWGRDENGRIFTPADSFYKYQTYINAANRRETPQIAVSLSPSLSPSPSLKEEKNKKPPHHAVAFELPLRVEKMTWDAFVEMRKKERHPLTEHAKTLIVRKLKNFMLDGHDPNEILNASTANGWRDVYEPKPKQAEGELSEETKRILGRGV